MFIDFLLSPEGQKIFEEKFRFATSTKNYGFKRWYPEKGYTLEQYEKAEDHWKKLLQGSWSANKPSYLPMDVIRATPKNLGLESVDPRSSSAHDTREQLDAS